VGLALRAMKKQNTPGNLAERP